MPVAVIKPAVDTFPAVTVPVALIIPEVSILPAATLPVTFNADVTLPLRLNELALIAAFVETSPTKLIPVS